MKKCSTNSNEIVTKRLALARILGPFGIHLLKFTPDTHPRLLMHYLELLELPVRICDAHHNTHETYLIYSSSMIAISSPGFLLLSCLHVRLRNALLDITKYMSLTGIIRNFGRLGYFLKCI